LNLSSTSNFAFIPLLHDALILDGNELTGSIPSELGSLANIQRIWLGKYENIVDLFLEKYGLNLSSKF